MTLFVTEMSPWQLFVMGGPMMWPLLVCSVVTWSVLIQKYGQVVSLNKGESLLKEIVVDKVRKNDIQGAVAACDGSSCFLAPVLREGLIKFGAPREDIVAVMEEKVRMQLPGLEKGLDLLSTIVRIAPLFGFLGTVLGLCTAFHVIQVREAALNPATAGDMAAGVWQALVATLTGFVVGALALMVHDYFAGRIVSAVANMERTSESMIEAMMEFSQPSFEGEREDAPSGGDRPSREDKPSYEDRE